MTTRQDRDRLASLLGDDLVLSFSLGGGYYEDADLVAGARPSHPRAPRDLDTIAGVDNLIQGIVDRLKTRRGELAALGHPDYGSGHHALVGEPNVERTRNLIKLHVLRALRREPRVAKVLRATVRPETQPAREVVRIELSLEVMGHPTPRNLVVPFSLEALP